ncbi:hypothetical protein ACN5ZK_13635 (plasmid) [Macrococcoides bohemicum]|uniref:hypothetical protein n=1 Tax=Macrococcoides bohemicum TaxID=1903056 RepID=UPI003B00352E
MKVKLLASSILVSSLLLSACGNDSGKEVSKESKKSEKVTKEKTSEVESTELYQIASDTLRERFLDASSQLRKLYDDGEIDTKNFKQKRDKIGNIFEENRKYFKEDKEFLKKAKEYEEFKFSKKEVEEIILPRTQKMYDVITE